MIHRGEILKKAISESGLAVKLISERCKISAATIYRLYHMADASLDDIVSIGKAINHDFKKEIPELRDPEAEDNLNWKFKYLELAEKYIQVMEERAEYQRQAGKK
jgi:predicted transcriptional regulator